MAGGIRFRIQGISVKELYQCCECTAVTMVVETQKVDLVKINLQLFFIVSFNFPVILYK